jgi:hypothetical protein
VTEVSIKRGKRDNPKDAGILVDIAINLIETKIARASASDFVRMAIPGALLI